MPLTLIEQILLLIIWKLGDDAYGVNIHQAYHDYSDKEVAFGTLYNNLDQLIKKGYATSFKGKKTAIRGGKAKVHYRITEQGLDALQAARELQNRLWIDIPETAFLRNKP